jgi:hypothetical protein
VTCRAFTRFFAATTAAMFMASPALAWGEYAHRLTARIANAELNPKARAEVRRILAAGGTRVDTPSCRLASIEDASVWPDCARSLGDAFAYSSAWHYQNISVCAAFDIGAACPDGNCVTAQIPRQLAIAADRRKPAAARARALAFVVHFTGDMHMPLHIGDKGDRGGNNIRADYGAEMPHGMNLHRIWDSELAVHALNEQPAITRNSPTAAQRRLWASGTVAEWAQQGWEISKSVAYGRLRQYPDTCIAGAVDQSVRAPIDQAYVAAATPAVRLQVQRAGVRLAVLLNGALGR